MLKTLNILNGKISPKFDPWWDTYKVIVNEDVLSLNLYYDIEEGDSIVVLNNNSFLHDENLVTIEVNNNLGEIFVYNLTVVKEKSQEVLVEENTMSRLEIPKNYETPSYVAPIISGVCFILILIVFKLLFLRSKKR